MNLRQAAVSAAMKAAMETIRVEFYDVNVRPETKRNVARP
jgi:hypothetical protein